MYLYKILIVKNFRSNIRCKSAHSCIRIQTNNTSQSYKFALIINHAVQHAQFRHEALFTESYRNKLTDTFLEFIKKIVFNNILFAQSEVRARSTAKQNRHVHRPILHTKISAHIQSVSYTTSVTANTRSFVNTYITKPKCHCDFYFKIK